MSEGTIYKCDRCGVEKKKTNFWWIVSMTPEGFRIHPWEKLRDFVGGEWVHCCGHNCASILLANWMAKVHSAEKSVDAKQTDV
jgi:hypothetical protein